MRRKGRKLIIGVLGCMAERVKKGCSTSMVPTSWPDPTPTSVCPTS